MARKGLEDAAVEFGDKSSRGQTLKVRQIGNSLGVVLPKETLARLRASEGDELYVTETETGLHLHRKDDEFEEHMRLVEKAMARYPNTLRALAK